MAEEVAAAHVLGPEARRAEDSLARLDAALTENSTNANALIQECEAAVKGAEIEVRTASASGTGQDEDKAWLRRAKARVQEAKRRVLLGVQGGAGAANTSGVAQAAMARQSALTDRMQAQADSLEQTRRTLQGAEATASVITMDLATQREQIQGISGKVDQTNADLGYSGELLKSMKTWWTFSSIQGKK